MKIMGENKFKSQIVKILFHRVNDNDNDDDDEGILPLKIFFNEMQKRNEQVKAELLSYFFTFCHKMIFILS